MSFRGYFSQDPRQWLRRVLTGPSSATMADGNRTPGSGEEPQDAANAATPAAAAAARALSRAPRVITKPTSRRHVTSTPTLATSMVGSFTDANAGAPASISLTGDNAKAKSRAKTRNDNQDFVPGPDFANSRRSAIGTPINASTAGTTASAGMVESFSQLKAKRGTMAERARRPALASDFAVDNLISGHVGEVDTRGYSKVNDTPPSKTGSKRKALDSRPGSARSKLGRSLDAEEATTTPVAPTSSTNVAHPAVLEPELMTDVNLVPATASSEYGPDSGSVPVSPSSPNSITIPTPKRRKSARISAKGTFKTSAKEEEEERMLAIETKEKHVWEVETILDENEDEYLIYWTPWDKNKKEICHYPFDWISKENVGTVAIDDWVALDEKRKDELREIGKQGKDDLSEDEGDDMSLNDPSPDT